jgi:plasmid stabilization system protein ParE
MSKITWSARSRHDVRLIREYISKDSPRIARSLTNRLVESVERLTRFPRAGEVIVTLSDVEYRQISFGSYRIVYSLASHVIEIITVVHAARLFKPDELP